MSDLVGSTALRVRVGEERAEALRRVHDMLLRTAVEAHGGVVVKGLGDGVLAMFDGASDAVTAAVAIQYALRRHNRAHSDEILDERVGLSAGDVTLEDGDVFGTPVVEASRLCAAATGGGILAADLVVLLTRGRGGHEFTSVGELELKGLGAPVAASEVSWLGEAVDLAPVPPQLSMEHAVPLVGRADALDTLRRALKEADRGRRVVLVSGEPGIGKTRLVEEFAREAHAEGSVVLWGRCDEDVAVPYEPFADALRWWVTACPPDRLDLGPFAGELVRLVPDLGRLVPGVEPPLAADAEIERHRLFAAVTDALVRLGADQPLVLVLDDIHWAARPTLLLLRHLTRATEPLRLLLIGTYRDTDLGRTHPLADVLGDLRREPGVDRLSLDGLDEGEVIDLVEAAAGQELDRGNRDLAFAVHAETAGNPFFVGEVLLHLAESGAVVRGEHGWERVGTELGLPEGVREVVGQRLSRLPETTNGVLAGAAVLGLEFDLRTLGAVVGLAPGEVLVALEPAEQASVIRPAPGFAGRYSFAHGLVRSTLYGELTTTKRLQLHAAAAAAVAGRGDDALDELAYHACESAALGDADAAVDHARRAGARAMDRLAFEDAVSHLRRALEVMSLGRRDDDLRMDLGLELGRALIAAGDRAHRDLLVGVGREALAAGDVGRLTRAALLLTDRLGVGELGTVDGDSIEVAETALASVGDADSSTRARLLAALASTYENADVARADTYAELAVAVADRLGDVRTLVTVLGGLVFHIRPDQALADRLAAGERLLGLARDVGDLSAQSLAWWSLAAAHLERGDIAASRLAADAMSAVAEQLGDPVQTWFAANHHAVLDTLTKPLDEAGVSVERSIALSKRTAAPPTRTETIAFAMRSALWLAAGDERALAADWEGADVASGVSCAFDIGRADGLVDFGRIVEAMELVTPYAADLDVIPRDLMWTEAVSQMGRVIGVARHGEHAAAVYDVLLPYAGRLGNGGVVCESIVDHGLALLAHTLGSHEDARRHYGDADALCSREGIGWLAVNLWTDWADVLDELDEVEEAGALRERALDHARHLGMDGAVRRLTVLTS